jgi:hypothetical protein
VALVVFDVRACQSGRRNQVRLLQRLFLEEVDISWLNLCTVSSPEQQGGINVRMREMTKECGVTQPTDEVTYAEFPLVKPIGRLTIRCLASRQDPEAITQP